MNKDREVIEEMFDSVAHKYDMLNHLLSAGVDRSWRRKLVRMASQLKPERILDVATGTGDLALLLAKRIEGVSVTGVDISEGMLSVAKEKAVKRGMDGCVSFSREDALELSFDSDRFDGVTVAFGVRNFENLERGMSELLRVLRPGGRLFVLELSMPTNRFILWFYRLYFSNILPFIGRLTSKSPTAYRYLYDSVEDFAKPRDFIRLLEGCGYSSCKAHSLTFGVATLYVAQK